MKPSVFAFGLSIAAALSTASVAKADAEDFAFCLNTDTNVNVDGGVGGEFPVGVVITNVGDSLNNTYGAVVVAANSFYGHGAGGEWKSGMGQFRLKGGSCYNVATFAMSHEATCAVTSGVIAGPSAIIKSTLPAWHGWEIASVMVLVGVSQSVNKAPVVNCPY